MFSNVIFFKFISSSFNFDVNDHITLKTPILVRSPKFSSFDVRQYLDGWPPGDTEWCRIYVFYIKFSHIFWGLKKDNARSYGKMDALHNLKRNEINVQVGFPKGHSGFSCMIIGISSQNSNVSYNIIHFPDRFIFLSDSMASNRIWQNRTKGKSSNLYFCPDIQLLKRSRKFA